MSAKDFEAVNQEILAETQKLAEAYREKFSGDPGGELRAWLQIALRREAMVSDVYEYAERKYRLPEPRGPAGDVAWDALTLIWHQEKQHTTTIEVRLKDGLLEQGAYSADMLKWLGTMEGKFLAGLTSRPSLRQVFTAAATHLGALFTPDKVPPFTLELGTMEPREFFILCAALETTARRSYERMEYLAKSWADDIAVDGPTSLQLEDFARRLRLMYLDETFHEEAFEEIASWIHDGHFDTSLDAKICAGRLAKLLPRSSMDVGDPNNPKVVTDGGLEELFQKHGIDVSVVKT